MHSLLTLMIVLFMTLAYAEPLKLRDTTGITQTELDQFELLAQYAGAAYCYDNIQIGTGNTVAYAAEGGYCPKVEAIRPVIVDSFFSLGAAIAALLGAILRNYGHCVDLYTFGQPSIGAVDVSNYIQNQAPAQRNNYRVTHTTDVVPQLPEHTWGDWDHYYPEFWISKKNGEVQTSDVVVVTGILYETTGNEGDKSGWGLPVDILEGLPAHYVYFNHISGCDPNAQKGKGE